MIEKLEAADESKLNFTKPPWGDDRTPRKSRRGFVVRS
jgi:hypothetical protein